MWRSTVLALAAFALVQLLSPNPATAVNSKGQWVSSPSWGKADVAPSSTLPPVDGGDCVIDVLDEQTMVFRYGAEWWTTLYHSRYDLEPSGTRIGRCASTPTRVRRRQVLEPAAIQRPKAPPASSTTRTLSVWCSTTTLPPLGLSRKPRSMGFLR